VVAREIATMLLQDHVTRQWPFWSTAYNNVSCHNYVHKLTALYH